MEREKSSVWNKSAKVNKDRNLSDEGIAHVDLSLSDKRTEEWNASDKIIMEKDTDCVVQNKYETRIVDKEKFDRIVQSIRKGQCHHVEQTLEKNEECITETRVYGIHVIAAIQTEQNILNYMRVFQMINQLRGVFSVHPVATFILKNNEVISQSNGNDVFQSLMNIGGHPIKSDSVLWLINRLSETEDVFKLKPYPVLYICAKLKNIQVLHSFVEAHFQLYNFAGIAEIMESVVSHGFEDLKKILMEKLLSSNTTTYASESFISELQSLAKVAITQNRPDILDKILSVMSSTSDSDSNDFYDQLLNTCYLLNRGDCKVVVTNYYSPNPYTTGDQDTILNLLLLRWSYPCLKDEIKVALKQMPNIQHSINIPVYQEATYNLCYDKRGVPGELITPLEIYTRTEFRISEKMIGTVPRELLYTISELGASTDVNASDWQTPLTLFLIMH